MPDLYSPALGVALAGAIIALLMMLDLRLAAVPIRPEWLPRMRTVARIAAGTALLAFSISLVSHLFLGHMPGSENAMGPVGFVREHPMLLLVAVMSVTTLLLARGRG